MKLVDFGVAKQIRTDDHTLTGSTDMVGSPAYMSPEQAKGERDVDGRADIWALGVVLYEAVVGRRPFVAESFGELLVTILHDSPATIGADTPLPRELSRIIHRCLAKSRDERFASIEALADALKPFAVAGSSIPSRPRWPWLVGVAASVAGVAVVASLAARGSSSEAVGSSASQKVAPSDTAPQTGQSVATSAAAPLGSVGSPEPVPPAKPVGSATVQAPQRPAPGPAPQARPSASIDPYGTRQ